MKDSLQIFLVRFYLKNLSNPIDQFFQKLSC